MWFTANSRSVATDILLHPETSAVSKLALSVSLEFFACSHCEIHSRIQQATRIGLLPKSILRIIPPLSGHWSQDRLSFFFGYLALYGFSILPRRGRGINSDGPFGSEKYKISRNFYRNDKKQFCAVLGIRVVKFIWHPAP